MKTLFGAGLKRTYNNGSVDKDDWQHVDDAQWTAEEWFIFKYGRWFREGDEDISTVNWVDDGIPSGGVCHGWFVYFV